jgi:hypothetical protein
MTMPSNQDYANAYEQYRQAMVASGMQPRTYNEWMRTNPTIGQSPYTPSIPSNIGGGSTTTGLEVPPMPTTPPPSGYYWGMDSLGQWVPLPTDVTSSGGTAGSTSGPDYAANLAEQKRQFDLQYALDQQRYGAGSTMSATDTASQAMQQAQLIEQQRQFNLSMGMDLQQANQQAQYQAAQLGLSQQQLAQSSAEFGATFGLSQQTAQADQAYRAAQLGLTVQQLQQQEGQFGATFGLQQEQFAADQAYRQQQLEAEKQRNLAALAAKGPQAWLEYALAANQTPVGQDWMVGQNVMGNEGMGNNGVAGTTGIQRGQALPNWQGLPASTTQVYQPTMQQYNPTQFQTPNLPAMSTISAPSPYTPTPYSPTPISMPQMPVPGTPSAGATTPMPGVGGNQTASPSATGAWSPSGQPLSPADTAMLSGVANAVQGGSTGAPPPLTPQQVAAMPVGSGVWQGYVAQGGQVPGGSQGFYSPSSPSTYPFPEAQPAMPAPVAQTEAPLPNPQDMAILMGYQPMANGGFAMQPTRALVGEQGPELANLAPGSSVIPLRNADNMMDSGLDRGLSSPQPYVDNNISWSGSIGTPKTGVTAPIPHFYVNPGGGQVAQPQPYPSNPVLTPSPQQPTTGSPVPTNRMPSLTTPSRQYQARMSPDQLAQYYAYQQMVTGATPESQQWSLWNQGPPSGQNRGFSYRR